MKELSVREIIKELERLGFEVEYKVRYEGYTQSYIKKQLKKYAKGSQEYVNKAQELALKRFERGVRITSINGEKYTASQGNVVARKIVGTQLSSKRASQLEKIRRQRVSPLPSDIEKLIKKGQRYRLERLKKGEKDYGKITTRQIRKILAGENGKKKAENILEYYIRRQKDLAPVEMWHELIQHIELNAPFLKEFDNFMELYNLVYSANIEKTNVYDVRRIHDILYDLIRDYNILSESDIRQTIDTLITIVKRFQ